MLALTDTQALISQGGIFGVVISGVVYLFKLIDTRADKLNAAHAVQEKEAAAAHADELAYERASHLATKAELRDLAERLSMCEAQYSALAIRMARRKG